LVSSWKHGRFQTLRKIFHQKFFYHLHAWIRAFSQKNHTVGIFPFGSVVRDLDEFWSAPGNTAGSRHLEKFSTKNFFIISMLGSELLAKKITLLEFFTWVQ
jgi:hypothetical protein